jgi:hypothetical protein
MVVPSAVGRHRENSSQSVNNPDGVDHFLENEIVRVRTVASLTSAQQLLTTVVQMGVFTLSRFFLLMATGRVRRAIDEMRALLLLPFGVVEIRERRDAMSTHRAVSISQISCVVALLKRAKPKHNQRVHHEKQLRVVHTFCGACSRQSSLSVHDICY